MLTGYSKEDSTWEPEKNIPGHIVEEYKKKIKDRRKKKKPVLSTKSLESETWNVESISNCRIYFSSKTVEYLVKRKGCNFVLLILKLLDNLFSSYVRIEIMLIVIFL